MYNGIAYSAVKLKELQMMQNNMDKSQEHNIRHKSYRIYMYIIWFHLYKAQKHVLPTLIFFSFANVVGSSQSGGKQSI